MASSRPAMTVEIDFVNDPTSATETWTDVTTYCRARGADSTILTTDRGRNYELAKSTAGTFQLVLDNTDGRFDPTNLLSPYVTGAGNPGSAPGLVTAGRRIRIRATWASTTYSIFRGYVDEWPQEWTDAGFYGTASISGTDALAVLAAINLTAITVVETLRDSPMALYRCDDSVGSVSAGNTSSTVQPLSAIVAGSTAAVTDTFEFGGTAGDGALAADQSTSLTFTPGSWNAGAAANKSGYVLRTADDGVGPLLPRTGGWALECWFRTANSTKNNSGRLFYQVDRVGGAAAQVDVYFISLSSNRGIGLAALMNTTAASGGAGIATSTNVADDQWHHLLVGLDATRKIPYMYVDGVLVVDSVNGASVSPSPSAIVWRPPLLNQWGGDTTPTQKAGTGFADVSLKNLALYAAAPTAARALAHYKAGSAFSGETSGARIGRLLDAAAWPTALRNVATGDSKVGSQVTEDTAALTCLEQVNDTEVGNLFVDGAGRVSFTNRRSRFNGTSVASFGEQENRYVEGIQVQLDSKDVYNDVTTSRNEGITVRNIDPASQRRYFPRSLSLATVAVDDANVVYTGEYLLDRYRNPIARIPKITLEASSDPTLWPQSLGREVGDRITVTRRPGGAQTLSADYFIEAVSHAVSGATWRTTWLLSPASMSSYFVLDSTVYGRLGGGSTLSASMTASQTTLVTPNAVFNASDVPYVVLVGSERMTVTAATTPGSAPQTLTVTRGVGGTTASTHSAASAVVIADVYGLGF